MEQPTPLPAIVMRSVPAAHCRHLHFLAALSVLVTQGLLGLASSPVDASAQAPSIVLEEVWRLGEEGDDLLFGEVYDIASDAAGRIYVADDQNSVVHVLSASGSPITTVGGPGEGPGEFQSVDNVTVSPDGGVYVWDSWLGRVSVFAEQPGGEFEFTESVYVERHNEQVPRDLIGVQAEGMLFVYYTPLGFCDVCRNEADRFQSAVLVDKRGQAFGGPLATLPVYELIIEKREGGITVEHKPFGRTSHMVVSPSGRLYSGWSEDLRIHARSLSGDWTETYTRSFEPLPVARSEVNEATRDWNSALRSLLRAAGRPTTRPAYRYFAIDDRDRIWVQTSVARGATTAACVIIGANAANDAVTFVPDGVTLKTIRAGQAVGLLQEEGGGPVVIAFSVVE